MFKVIFNMEKTVIAGVLVFIVSQYFLKLILEPVLELKRIIARVAFSLNYYGLVYNPTNLASILAEGSLPEDENREEKEKTSEMRKELLVLASQLRAQTRLILFFAFFRNIFFLPDDKSLKKASDNLIWLHNVTEETRFEDVVNYETAIKKLLQINF
ncbi:MAG: hypothetical protein ACE5HO_05220 [bacterium]